MKKIAVVTGGNSKERDIALKSGQVVFDNIDRSLFEPYLVLIDGSNWYLKDGNIPIDKNDFSFYDKEKIQFDAVFNIIHGPPGEDGQLQAYWDMVNMPYTGSGVLAASLTFDKHRTKVFLNEVENLHFAKSIFINCDNRNDIEASYIADQLGLPLFIKPNRAGSSYGISKAKTVEDIAKGIEEAFKHDDEVLVEEMISGTEITCGVLRNDCGYDAFPVTEIVTNNDFFDYDAKYTVGKAEEITPARIDKTMQLQCQKVSVNICERLHTKGVIRADYIMQDEDLYLIEVNTIPGLSNESIIPKQAAALGMSLTDLFTQMLQEALVEK